MNHKRSLVKIIFCSLAFSVTITATAQNKNEEKNKLSVNPGQKFQVDNTVKTVSSMEMMGQQMDMSADIIAVRLFEVKDKKESNYKVASTITKLIASANAMGQAMSYDSEKKEDTASELSKALKDKINVPVEMEMNDEGKVVSAKKDTAANNKQGMGDMLGSIGADETAITDDLFLLVPKNIKVGDTWSDSVITDGLKTYRDYTVKSLQGNDATLTLSGKQVMNKIMENMGMEMTMTMDSKLTGEIVVDTKSSIIKQRSLTADGTGSMDVMGQSVPMTTKVETTSTAKSL
ncbi:MAG: DUF6263 family protein [Bacteroidota bacterium]